MTTITPGPAVDETESSRIALPTADWAALFAAAVFCCGFFTGSVVAGWTPRFAALLAVAPLGLLYLYRLVRERDLPAAVLVGGLTWASVIVVAQPSPLVRVFGTVGLESSLLILVSVAACWGLGRQVSESGRVVLPWVVIGALAISGVVGVLQVVAQTDSGVMVLQFGRAHGLATASVHYGSLMSAATVLLAALEVPRRWRWAQLTGVLGFAICSGLSGSRAAFMAALLGVGYLVVRRRNAMSWLSAGAVLTGTLMAMRVSDYFAARSSDPSPTGSVASGTGRSTLTRLTDGAGGAGGGLSWRFETWEAGLRAWAERPITGWGLGNFRQALQGAAGPDFAGRAPYFDAHNVFVEVLTAVGLPGLVIFGAFAVLCARPARGPLALAAGTLAWSWLLQPAGMSTLPLALLFVGAAFGAAPLPRHDDPHGDTSDPTVPTPDAAAVTPVDRPVRLAVAFGVVLGSAFFVADLRLAAAARDDDPAAVQSAAAAFPVDPVVAALVAQSWTSHAISTTGVAHEMAIESALDWSHRAIDRQPDAPRWRDDLAVRLAVFLRYDDAVRVLGEALDLQPRRPESLELLEVIGDVADDPSIDDAIAELRCSATGVDCVSGR